MSDKQAEGIPSNAFYYDSQMRRSILQFMAIFSGLQVQVGRRKTGAVQDTTNCDNVVIDTQSVFEEPRLVSVPIHYGGMDRIVASILAENVQNKPLRLPVLSAYARGLAFKKEYFTGLGQQRRNVEMPTGGLFPDDMRVIKQLKPLPFDLTMELGIYASNTDQHFQILEQILPLFDPSLQIQTSDSFWDWARISHVELTDIALDQNYPSGADKRIIQSTLTFMMPVFLSAPAEVLDEVVKKIYARISAINLSTVQTEEDVVAEINAQGINYELWFTSDTLTIK